MSSQKHGHGHGGDADTTGAGVGKAKTKPREEQLSVMLPEDTNDEQAAKIKADLQNVVDARLRQFAKGMQRKADRAAKAEEAKAALNTNT